MAVVQNTEDRDKFQNDINFLNKCCNKWLMKLNFDKCISVKTVISTRTIR